MKRTPDNIPATEVSDEALILLYYGEADDPQLAQRVAQSAELSARFEQLCTVMAALDEVPVADSSAAQNALRWARLAPQLAALPAPRPAWSRLLQSFFMPRWSLAGSFGLACVAVLAFWLGGHWSGAPPRGDLGEEVASLSLAGSDSALDAYLSRHLEDAERWLSHVDNQAEPPSPQWTASLLRNNRVYRIRLQNPTLRAALHQGNQVLPLLQQLEQELLLYANPGPLATAGAANDSHHLQRLLFQLRVINQQWNRNAPNVRGYDDASTIRT